jgi:hypothetical protein
MTVLIQTPSGDYVHPRDFVRRRRWASDSLSPVMTDAAEEAVREAADRG